MQIELYVAIDDRILRQGKIANTTQKLGKQFSLIR